VTGVQTCALPILAGREDLMVAVKLIAAEEAIEGLLAAVRQLGSDPKA